MPTAAQDLTILVDEVVARLKTMTPELRELTLALIDRELRRDVPVAATKKHPGRPKGSKNRPSKAPSATPAPDPNSGGVVPLSAT